ncbi:MAG: hypothetical protein ACFFCS_06270 [Candidatus Hodarchaeota archaeon]
MITWIFGALSLVALRNPSELIVFDPIEDRQSEGVYDKDENVDAQIEDIRFLHDRMDTDDPEALKNRIIDIFKFIERHELFFQGILELEANAFESSLFVDVDLNIVTKLEKMHKMYCDGRIFPKVERSDYYNNKIRMRYLGRAVNSIWPRTTKGMTKKDFIVNLNNLRGQISGVVVVNRTDAEFVVLQDTINAKGSEAPLDWIVLKELLADFKGRTKVPITWFKWSYGLQSLFTVWGFDQIKDDPEVKEYIDRYNQRIADMVVEHYKDMAPKVGAQTNLAMLSAAEKDKAEEDLLEAMELLDKMLEETDE